MWMSCNYVTNYRILMRHASCEVHVCVFASFGPRIRDGRSSAKYDLIFARNGGEIVSKVLSLPTQPCISSCFRARFDEFALHATESRIQGT